MTKRALQLRSLLQMYCLVLIFVISTAQSCTAAQHKGSSHPIEIRGQSSDGWELVEGSFETHRVHLEIGLKQARFDELERRLYEVSDPQHVAFGQYLTDNEVDRLISPYEETLSTVEDWLHEHNITTQQLQYSRAQDWLTLDVAISTAEELLCTRFAHYHHIPSKRYIRVATDWSLPGKLNGHIDSIYASSTLMYAPGTEIDFPRSVDPEEQDSNEKDPVPDGENLNQVAEGFLEDLNLGLDLDNLPADLASDFACNVSAVTPLCVRLLYGTLEYKAKAPIGNSMALVNFAGESNNRSDIDLFLKQYRPDAARDHAAYTWTEDNLDGALNPQTPAALEQLARKAGREGNLDAQAFLSIAHPTPLVVYTVPKTLHPPFIPDLFTPTNTNEPFLAWLRHVLSLPDSALPKVVAMSYGDIEQTVPYSYAKRVCESFAQLGVRGVTVVFGAGDSGVGKPGYCHSNNGSNATEFLTSFPASCPYGTSVGATRQFATKDGSGIEEAPAHNPRNGFVTGGGFSRYFPRPKYQDSAVHAYLDIQNLGDLKKDGRYAGLFNSSGRAYPDVSISGYRRAMTWYGRNYLVDGTSVSCPTFAAVVALVNDALLAEGKPTLGFLNPWLYSTGWQAFKDVVEGNNSGCGTEGYPAGEGWDPASGWGVPWFPKFRDMALQRKSRAQRPWYWYKQVL